MNYLRQNKEVSQVMQSRIIHLVPMIDFCSTYYSKAQNYSKETVRMVEQDFRAIVAGELSLLKIIRSKNNLCLSSINPELFSEAVIRLEVFDAENMILSTDHYRVIT